MRRLEEIKKENEKIKRESFVSKARIFEQKKGPTDEDRKLAIQKAAAQRKFEKQLQKNLKSNERVNPMAAEIQFRRQLTSPADGESPVREEGTGTRDWELIQQIGAPSYYWNRVTNETTYELPTQDSTQVQVQSEEAAEAQSQAQAQWQKSFSEVAQAAPPPTRSEDQGWLSCQNEDGSQYYWNYLTNEAVLTLPAHLDPNSIPPYLPESAEEADSVSRVLSPEEKQQAESDPNNWTSEWDEHYQATYYRNHITETLQWDPPLCLVPSTTQSTVDPPAGGEVHQQEERTPSPTSHMPAEQQISEQSDGRSEETQPAPPTVAIKDEAVDLLAEVEEILEQIAVQSVPIYEANDPAPLPPPSPPARNQDFAQPRVLEAQTKADSRDEGSHEVKMTGPENVALDSVAPKTVASEPIISEASEPIISEASEPAATEPVATEPAATEPVATEPVKMRVSPPPPPPPPPRKLSTAPLPSPEPKPESGASDPQDQEPPVKQTETNASVEVAELEVEETDGGTNGGGDDEVLVGDGSKPVGCTACVLS
jgi:hypothetical protein